MGEPGVINVRLVRCGALRGLDNWQRL